MSDPRKLLSDWFDFLDDDLPEAEEARIESAVEQATSALCRVLGHEPVMDHCGKPEHDECAWCRERMPGQAKRERT